jgi:hypothetical protein
MFQLICDLRSRMMRAEREAPLGDVVPKLQKWFSNSARQLDTWEPQSTCQARPRPWLCFESSLKSESKFGIWSRILSRLPRSKLSHFNISCVFSWICSSIFIHFWVLFPTFLSLGACEDESSPSIRWPHGARWARRRKWISTFSQSLRTTSIAPPAYHSLASDEIRNWITWIWTGAASIDSTWFNWIQQSGGTRFATRTLGVPGVPVLRFGVTGRIGASVSSPVAEASPSGRSPRATSDRWRDSVTEWSPRDVLTWPGPLMFLKSKNNF